ncbi:MAG: hypothetical protein A2072_02480 [Nitrospirae bacterium GWC1_57_7]|nr:MAG: hypothetical protein A2072_02480 [Nitrospirae bacterium GWC1_57_7]
MKLPLTDLIALAAIIVWPVIPLFWIPVHCLPRFFRRIGLFTYLLPVLTWLPLAYGIILYRHFFLSGTIQMPAVVNGAGWVLITAGLALQLWRLLLLRLPGIMGMPEIMSRMQGRMVTSGPFGKVRHPTYLSHTMMFLGVFLSSGVISVGIITILDLIVVNAVVIPLEERELVARFGDEYEHYRRNVRGRIVPWRGRGSKEKAGG